MGLPSSIPRGLGRGQKAGGGSVVGASGGSVVGAGGVSVVEAGAGSVVGAGGRSVVKTGGGSMELSGFGRGVNKPKRREGDEVGKSGNVTSSIPVDRSSVVTPGSLPPVGCILIPRNVSMDANISVTADSGEVIIRPHPLALTVPKKCIQIVEPVTVLDKYNHYQRR